jgi:hypothetical protein
VVKLQKTNVVGRDLMSAPGKGRSQGRLPGTDLAGEGDAAPCNVDRRRMERGNSALVAQHSERGAE